MNVFIIGGSGLVGGNCLDYCEQHDHLNAVGSHLSFATDRTVFFNTQEPGHPNNFDLEAFNPDVIIHCGALTWVDYCETHPEESYEKTVGSTLEAIAFCKKYSAQLVYLSTDYIFNGEDGPYLEDATIAPLNVYGKHKLEAEQAIQNALEDPLIVRITNVYGNEVRGKNFVARLIEMIKSGETKELQLPYDQFATPVNAWDVARVIFTLIENNKSGVYHAASTDYVNRYQLALKVVRHFGRNGLNLTPISTASLNQAATRPLLGGLISKKFIHEFPEFKFGSLDDYLSELATK